VFEHLTLDEDPTIDIFVAEDSGSSDFEEDDILMLENLEKVYMQYIEVA
jgi:hypothetical protein